MLLRLHGPYSFVLLVISLVLLGMILGASLVAGAAAVGSPPGRSAASLHAEPSSAGAGWLCLVSDGIACPLR